MSPLVKPGCIYRSQDIRLFARAVPRVKVNADAPGTNSVSRVPPSDDNTTEEGGGDRYCGGTPGVSPDTLGHGGNPTTPVKIPPRLNLSFDTETPADQSQKQDDDFFKAKLLT